MDSDPKFPSVGGSPDDILCLYADELEQLMIRASSAGARRVLSDLKLDDADAVRDLHDMRGIVRDWRTIRTELLKRLTNMAITVGVLVLAGLAARYGIDWSSGP